MSKPIMHSEIFKITRLEEKATEKALPWLGKGIWRELDQVAPGWVVAEYWFVEIEDGMDIVYKVNDVFIRGWDMTGAINARKSKKR